MRLLFLITFSLGFCISASAQKYELSLFSGISNYTGDVNQEGILYMGEMHMAYGAQLQRNLSGTTSIGVEYVYAQISGDDQNFEERRNWTPNINFSAPLHELNFNFRWSPFNKRILKLYDEDGYRYDYKNAVGASYNAQGIELKQEGKFFTGKDKSGNLWVYNIYGDLTIYNEDFIVLNSKYKQRVSPFLMLGAGVLYAAPTPNGMAPEAPEMDPTMYSRFHFTTPIGGGITFDLHPAFNIHLESTLRYPFSDYIDGVSDSRDPENMDWYFFAGARFALKLGKMPSYKTYLQTI